MDWSRDGLAAEGFEGFVPFSDLPDASVPCTPGVYVVLRVDGGAPVYRVTNPAGRFKGRDPSVPRETLSRAWVPDTGVVYIGKASEGSRRRRGLNKRLDEYRRFGAGEAFAHWGGRFIWQLADSDRLLVAWRSVENDDPEKVESSLILQFTADFGARPFANRKLGAEIS